MDTYLTTNAQQLPSQHLKIQPMQGDTLSLCTLMLLLHIVLLMLLLLILLFLHTSFGTFGLQMGGDGLGVPSPAIPIIVCSP